MNAPRRLALVFALFLAACGGDDTPPVPDTDAGPEVDLGVEDDAGRPDPDAGCVAGTIGCACDAGMCATGVCAMGICTTCPVASEGCACRSNGTCDSGLRCDASGTTCETCPPGELDCACDALGACGVGLVCMGGMCTLETCAAGSVDCPCRMDAPRCDGDAYCDSTTCRTCAPDVAGCPCASDGSCGPGLACEVSTCRVALTCEELVTRGTCGVGQVCDVFPSGDPRCVPGACVAGYRWSTELGRCLTCTSPDCAAEPTCTLGVPGSIADTCTAQRRDCVTDVDGIGRCGDCNAGLLESAGLCVFANACGSGSCAATEYCDATTDPLNPTCRDRPCANPAEVRTATGCVPCGRVCSSPGQTGACWPIADLDGRGVCETSPGFYAENSGSRGAVACDADRDGWVRREVGEILDGTPGFPADPALVANARCEVRKAGAVELVDEYGNVSRIVSCAEGLFQDPAPSTACTPFPLRLFETRVNDAGEGATGAVPPVYATGVAPMREGRAFRPAELNGLTKGCVDLADFDGDGNEDVGQSQPTPLDTSTMSESTRLRSFAHFVELYRTAWTAPAPGEALGVLTIAERSRCEASFPLTYGSDTLYTASAREPRAYWRSCERDRDPDFNADLVGTPGFDFARYSCDARSGRCGVNPGTGARVVDGPSGSAWSTLAAPPQPAPASASASALPAITIGTSPMGARTLASGTLLRGHGLCELGGARPADGRFRGMNHHSQFQCVQVVPDAVTPTRSWQHRRAEFGGPSATNATATPATTLTFNACRAKDCGGADGCVDSVASAGRDASDPVVECDVALLDSGAPALPAEGATGWAAVRYQSYAETAGTPAIVGDATYNGGCVNEVAEWPNLCPRALFGACDAGGSDAFGRFCCDGCPATVGCPRDHAAGTCRNGVCDTATCDAGWGNCDDPAAAADVNGCENPLNTTRDCNACGARCEQPNANMICTETNPADPDSEVCRRDPARTLGSGTGCEAGWGDCNGMPEDGCENPLESAAVGPSIAHCGACGASCTRPNATVTCAGDGAGGGRVGTCALSACNANWFNADTIADLTNGCEFFDNNTNGVCTGVDTMPPAGVTYSATLTAAGATWTSAIGMGAAAVDRRTPGVWVTPPTPRPTLAENWYKFYFPRGSRGMTNGPGVGAPRVYLSSGAGTFVIDVWAFTSGGGTASAACTSIAPDSAASVTRTCTKPSATATGTAAIGGASGLNGGTTGLQGWSFIDNVSPSPDSVTTPATELFRTTDNGWPEYVYVRVRRRVPGSLDTTPTYRLTVTR